MELSSLCLGSGGRTSLPLILRRNTHCKIRGLEEETTEEKGMRLVKILC